MFRNTSCIWHSLVAVQLVVVVEVIVVAVAVPYYLSPADSAGREGPGVLMEEAGEDCGAG